MADAATAYKAGQELGDIVNLVLDEISNKEQLVQFASEVFQAVQSLAGVGIPATQKAAVASHIVEGLVNRVNEAALKLE